MSRKGEISASAVFGPVPSRRLGISLGVDLVPSKVCSLDCVYCEAGKTSLRTLKRREYRDVAAVIRELDGVLAARPRLDYVTFSGAGEPTLNSGIGRVVRFLKEKHPQYRICLITNGTFLGRNSVIRDISGIDLVIPSLDAADEATFRSINRPCRGIACRKLVEGLVKFRRKSKKIPFWLEIFVVPGCNDSPKSIRAIRMAVKRIGPDRIQLNTLDRPGTEDTVEKAGMETLLRFQNALSGLAPVDIVGKFASSGAHCGESESSGLEKRILDMISRRPCTASDLSESFGVSGKLLSVALEKLVGEGAVLAEKMPRGIFYRSAR